MKEEFNLEEEGRAKNALQMLKLVETRDSRAAAAGRAKFLAQAEEYARQAVSSEEKSRHSGWISNFLVFLKPRKERTPMNIIVSVVMIVSMVLGTGGLTVAAAQSSLPNDLLYPVKVWSEDVRLDLAPDAQTRLQLEMEFSERRVAEAQAMVQRGEVPPEAVQVRLEIHLQTAMQAALGQANEEALLALEQIQARMQIQLQTMEQLQTNQPDNAVTERMRQTLREQLRLAELGLEDPEQLRLMQQEQERNNRPDDPPMQATQGSGNGPGPQATQGSGDGPGPQPTPSGDPNPQPTPGGDPNPQPTPGGDPNPQPTPGGDPNPQPTPGGDPNPQPTPGGDPNPQPTPYSGDGPGPGPQPTPGQGTQKP